MTGDTRPAHVQDSSPDSALPITQRILTKTFNPDANEDAVTRITTIAFPELLLRRAKDKSYRTAFPEFIIQNFFII